MLFVEVYSRCGRDTYKLLKHSPPVYIGIASKVEKAILKHYSREVLELIPYILELRRCWKRRIEEVEKIGIRRKDGRCLSFRFQFWNAHCIHSISPQLAILVKVCRKLRSIKHIEKSQLLYFQQTCPYCRFSKLFGTVGS